MKSFLLITCCLVIFTFFNGIAENSIIFSKETLQTESQPQQTGSSVMGGLLILVSIGIGYGTRKIYEIRARNQEEIH